MNLILWRHADAEDGAPDAARRLTPKGVKQAEKMGKWLRARLPAQAVVLTSPARRAVETAQALKLDYRTDAALGTSAAPEALIAVTGWPDAAETMVLVGHQPTLGEVAALLMSGRAAEWSIKKGGVVWLESRGGEAALRAALSPDLL